MLKNLRNIAFAFATLIGVAGGAGAITMMTPDNANACQQSNPCQPQAVFTLHCGNGTVQIIGSEAACNPDRFGGQEVGIAIGKTPKQAYFVPPAPRREVRQQAYVPAPQPSKVRPSATLEASVNASANLATTSRCGGEPFRGDGVTITILPCPPGNSAKYVAGVPGQAQLIRNNLIALQNSKAPAGCYWVKKLRRPGPGEKYMGRPITTTFVAVPAQGVVDSDGKGITLWGNHVASIEAFPGACKGKELNVPTSVSDIIRLSRMRG